MPEETPAEMIHNPGVYQVLAYCVAEGTSLGALIYPKWEFSQDDEIEIRGSTVRIRRFAIDLEVAHERLLDEAKALVDRVVTWIEQGRAATVHMAVGA